MAFAENAARGDVLSTVSDALLSAILFAIGISWTRAIREIILLIIPEDTNVVVLGELGAASLTTLLGVGIAVGVARLQVRVAKGRPGAVAEQEARAAGATRRPQIQRRI